MPIALILKPQGCYIEVRRKSPPWLWFCRCWWWYCCFGVWVGRLLLLRHGSTCSQRQLQVEVFCQCSLFLDWATAPLLATELYCRFSLSLCSYVVIVFHLGNMHLHHQLLLNPVHTVQLMNLMKNWAILASLKSIDTTSEQAGVRSMVVYLLSECLFLLQHGPLDVLLLHSFPTHKNCSSLTSTVHLQNVEMDVRCYLM